MEAVASHRQWQRGLSSLRKSPARGIPQRRFQFALSKEWPPFTHVCQKTQGQLAKR
jgi:hypothetical protein